MSKSNVFLNLADFVNIKKFSLYLICIILSTSCSLKQSFLISSKVPAARGNVKIKMDNNKNHTIEVSLSNLAEPSRLSPAKLLYIVWLETDQKAIKNIGQIITDNNLFSKTLKADFKTVTSYTPVRIFITAENDPNVQFPDYDIVITTSKF